MNRKFQIITILSLFIFVNSAKSQSEFLQKNDKDSSVKSMTSIAPLIGFGNYPKENFTFIRYGVAVNNIFASNSSKILKNVGFYYILEHANKSNFIEDQSSNYNRDILGLRYQLNNHFTLFAGVGIFQKGIFSESNVKRKELGVAYQINHLLFEIAMSNSIGKTFNVGYTIPLASKNN